MAYTALFTSVPPLKQASLSALEQLIRSFEIDVRMIPFADRLTSRIDNILTVIIAVVRGPSLHVFFWDPGFWGQLLNPQDDQALYDALLEGCIDFLRGRAHTTSSPPAYGG